jgi:hypothetical protein
MVAHSHREHSGILSSTAFEWRADTGRWRWLILGALGVAPAACGGRTNTAGTTSNDLNAPGQGGSQGREVAAGVGGSAAVQGTPVGGGGDSMGGQSAQTGGSGGGHPELQIPFPAAVCEGAAELGGGWLRCDNGLLHRPAASACASSVPRAEAVTIPPEYLDAGAYLQCGQDSDCSAAPYGYCEWLVGQTYGTFCQYGCTVDADCAAGQVCLCGDPVGTCSNARCSTDAECGPGQLCADYIERPACGGTAFACQTPSDECAAQSDCPQYEYCTLDRGGEGERRVCTPPGCSIGRPFLVEGMERVATPVARADWYSDADAGGVSRSSVDPRLRAELARNWAEQGLMEHASVAAFARFTLHLLSVGAPASLVQRAGDAMQDEIRHARACFELARDYSPNDVGPGPLHLDGALAESDLPSIVLGTVIEGCIGETVAALEAAEGLAHCQDVKVRAVLERITADESQHAELAWRFVEWALETGPRELESRVRGAFEAALAGPRSTHRPPSGFERELLRHGVVSPELRRALRERVLDEVIAPCARALLERPRARSDGRVATARLSSSEVAG